MLKLDLPEDVTIMWGSDFVLVKGPLGILIKKRGNFYLAQKEKSIFLWASDANKSKEDFYLALLNRLIIGVSRGFRQRLKLVGVGFKAFLREKFLVLKLGYSHEVVYKIPTDIQILVSKAKGTYILIKGKEYDRVKQVAKDIRAFRVPDIYKGKGILYLKERLSLKKGKKEGK